MMLVKIKQQEETAVRDMLPGDAFLYVGELYIRIEDEAHGHLIYNAVHVESGALMAFEDDDKAVRRAIKLVEVE